MRIIAGEFRSRPIYSPEGEEKTRPMPDFVREAIFSLLRGHTEGQTVIDVFGGTGSIGLEAISRGAARCVFIERDKEIARLLRSNIELLVCEDRAELVQADALSPSALARAPRPAHLIFFDPPFPLLLDAASRVRVYDQFSRFVQLLDDEGYAVLRTPWPFVEPIAPPEGFRRTERVRAGDPDEPDDAAEAPLEADEIEVLDAPDAAPPIEHRPPRDIPLEIEGAVGPETHVHGRSAVHLYMTARPG